VTDESEKTGRSIFEGVARGSYLCNDPRAGRAEGESPSSGLDLGALASRPSNISVRLNVPR
jgi:hypothetical protein